MKKLFTLLFAIMASAYSLFAESGTCGENLTWDLTDGVLTISGTGPMADYSFPNYGPWYSQRENIVSLVINDEVTSIGNEAFIGCSSLTSIEIPNSVTRIGSVAFSDCTGLTSVTITNSVTSIGGNAFKGCTGLTSPIYNAHVFAYMPTSYSGAYSIPEGIESIAGGAFQYCKNLTSVTIPNSVTTIGNYAFDGCKNLTSITLGNSVTSIGDNTFKDCTGLTSVTIPNSVISIGKKAFYRCAGLRSVIIGNGVTSIGDDAFYYCNSLSKIYSIRLFPPTISSNTFSDISSDAIVYVPNGGVNLYKTAMYWENLNIQSMLSSQSESFPTSVNMTFNNILWEQIGDYIVSCGIKGGEIFDGNTLEYIGLEPNSEYADVPVVLTSNTGESEVVNISFTTIALSLATQPSKPVSSNTAILLAETNIAEIEISCGFEYKRDDAPAGMEATKVYCPVANGLMAGRLKGLKDDVYYKYRAFYQSAAGNMYYGDWKYIFTGDVSVEFDPILYTYPAAAVTENSATLKGYALAGSDDFTEQGFEYWAESRVPHEDNAPAHMPAALGERHTITASGISMKMTLTDLDEGTVYKYRTYAKIGNQLLYGPEMAFSTQGKYTDTEDIKTLTATPDTHTRKLLRDGQILILRGDKAYTLTGQEVK